VALSSVITVSLFVMTEVFPHRDTGTPTFFTFASVSIMLVGALAVSSITRFDREAHCFTSQKTFPTQCPGSAAGMRTGLNTDGMELFDVLSELRRRAARLLLGSGQNQINKSSKGTSKRYSQSFIA
jgi:hypothetical protein